MLRGQSQPMLPQPGSYQYQDQHSFLVEKASTGLDGRSATSAWGLGASLCPGCQFLC